MGVSGCGKSTVGGVLAGRLGWDFGEGDDLHPQENVDKMASDHPLTDDDRWPWLVRVHEWMAEHVEAGRPAIITCSALKRSYRDLLLGGIASHVVFVYLHGDREQLLARLRARQGHFMPTALLDSQLADLEPLGADEPSITVDIDLSATVQAHQIADMLGL
ncbi:gluconokinase [uncultured Jatrophihabitans sp.]|uniref:gluconokinase n=1 Tax=uncultured Jatrophihabitans sp. TaxID=1610747 RepID=UPI0035CA5F5F